MKILSLLTFTSHLCTSLLYPPWLRTDLVIALTKLFLYCLSNIIRIVVIFGLRIYPTVRYVHSCRTAEGRISCSQMIEKRAPWRLQEGTQITLHDDLFNLFLCSGCGCQAVNGFSQVRGSYALRYILSQSS